MRAFWRHGPASRAVRQRRSEVRPWQPCVTFAVALRVGDGRLGRWEKKFSRLSVPCRLITLHSLVVSTPSPRPHPFPASFTHRRGTTWSNPSEAGPSPQLTHCSLPVALCQWNIHYTGRTRPGWCVERGPAEGGRQAGTEAGRPGRAALTRIITQSYLAPAGLVPKRRPSLPWSRRRHTLAKLYSLTDVYCKGKSRCSLAQDSTMRGIRWSTEGGKYKEVETEGAGETASLGRGGDRDERLGRRTDS